MPPAPNRPPPLPLLPAQPSAEALARHLDRRLATQVGIYRQRLDRCRRAPTRAHVHALRTAIRRLLTGLDLEEAVRADRPAVRRWLKRQSRALGKLRNAQLQLKRVKKIRKKNPDLNPLLDVLRSRERHRLKAVRKRLASRKVLRRLERWRPGETALRPNGFRRLLRMIDRQLQEAFDPLGSVPPDAPFDPPSRHRLRVLARDYRFMVESLRPAWRGVHTRRFLSTLKTQQDLVGQIHDGELLAQQVDRLAANGSVGSASVQWLRADRLREKTELIRRCATLDREVFHSAMLARQELRRMIDRTSRSKQIP